MSTRDHPDWWRPMGGQNSQDSTLERRSLIWNDEDIVDGVVPDVEYDTPDHQGKFFTRGCRGMIESIQVYCRGAVPNLTYLGLSPHPGLGPLNIVALVAAVPWAWVDVPVEEMWNYDSLFVWVQTEGVNLWIGGCNGQPFDTHESDDDGVTWSDVDNRLFIRVVYSGETPGDVPVSGTVNVIEIPSVGAQVGMVTVGAVVTNVRTTICGADRAGTMVEARLEFRTSAAPTIGTAPPAIMYELVILADDQESSVTTNRELTQSYVATSGRSGKGEFYQGSEADPEYDRTVMLVRLPIKFRRRITLQARHTTGVNVTVEGMLSANLIR